MGRTQDSDAALRRKPEGDHQNLSVSVFTGHGNRQSVEDEELSARVSGLIPEAG